MKLKRFFVLGFLFIFVFSFWVAGTNGAFFAEENTTTQQDATLPWEAEGAKQPKDYSYKEFNSLTDYQKNEFVNTFGSYEKFEKWMDELQASELQYAWEKDGAKQPSDYTYDEFNALSPMQKEAFIQTFESEEKFDKWLDNLTDTGSTADEAAAQDSDANNKTIIVISVVALIIVIAVIALIILNQKRKKKAKH